MYKEDSMLRSASSATFELAQYKDSAYLGAIMLPAYLLCVLCVGVLVYN
jgi:hypothetical protein